MTQVNCSNVTRIMVYSHDAFGLGNLRRMLAICEHLLDGWSNLSILLVSGSPMIHEFRLPEGLDYIKLPCLNRGVSGQLSAKYLKTSIEETVALRSQLIQSAAAHFKPDLLLVDKKPTGLNGELASTLYYLQDNLPESKCVLLLRDILDSPEKTIDDWVKRRYYQTIETHYDQVLVVGMQTVFDLVKEYRLPPAIANKVRYCGYIRKWTEVEDSPEEKQCQRAEALAQLHLEPIDLSPADRLVLVTPGGGEDGYGLVSAYLSGLQTLAQTSHFATGPTFHSLVLCGPEMPLAQQIRLQQQGATCANTTFRSFTNNLRSYIKAADVIVAMSGYNTVTEILSLRKSAVVVPRIKPSQEQLIRAIRFTQRDWMSMIHPERMTGRSLMQAVLSKLSTSELKPNDIDFNGLPNIAHCLSKLISPTQLSTFSSLISLLV